MEITGTKFSRLTLTDRPGYINLVSVSITTGWYIPFRHDLLQEPVGFCQHFSGISKSEKNEKEK
jgi:hypothetical protein